MSAITAQAQATAEAARAVHDAARSHHRAASSHRRESQRLMEIFDRMRKDCAQFGIEVVIVDEPVSRQETPRNAPQRRG